ncbi:hypothetical protein RND71_025625 [Anisodus tanguticus]|uniref:Uncharacterized protein n=1 Tax=Anisodus tanguticus TaxID=243964 RepID=A0AAE1RQD3_9SOLA|nr:hypothetical protein RND71_025625 [Anisodus tanguticus]
MEVNEETLMSKLEEDDTHHMEQLDRDPLKALMYSHIGSLDRKLQKARERLQIIQAHVTQTMVTEIDSGLAQQEKGGLAKDTKLVELAHNHFIMGTRVEIVTTFVDEGTRSRYSLECAQGSKPRTDAIAANHKSGTLEGQRNELQRQDLLHRYKIYHVTIMLLGRLIVVEILDFFLSPMSKVPQGWA